jgi:hypothetical protein
MAALFRQIIFMSHGVTIFIGIANCKVMDNLAPYGPNTVNAMLG